MKRHEAVILAVGRSPLARSHRGAYRSTRIDDVAAAVVRNLMVRVPGLAPSDIEDVIVGCAMPEGEQGYNVARNIAILAGLPVEIGGVTVNRFCSSSLDAIGQAAMCVVSGHGDAFIAGGVESMSHVSIGGFNPSFNEKLMREGVPDAYISMGATAENIARHYAISREEQDRFALASHRKAVSTQTKNGFDHEIVPVETQDESGRRMIVSRDEGPRADTSMDALANLKPAFAKDGTVTAGNSSPLTDGAAFAVVASKRFAKRIGAKQLARIRASAVVGLDPAFMGLGPVYAVPKVLARAKMKMKNVDLIEINEAFASQSLAVMRELDLEEKKLNVHGGAIALGHPLGASGARILATLLSAMQERDAGTGLIAMCVGGGQGAAMVVER
jgi:acetyl-CoA acetyltransferase family protein